MATQYILALDQGTTSSRAILFDGNGQVVATGQREFQQIYPQPGWVEHDPEEIWQSVWHAIEECLGHASVSVDAITAIGITNQRETAVVWNKTTGRPVYNAIVWQCRRTADFLAELRSQDRVVDMIRQKTGLVIDAYFSASKVAWILDHVPDARSLAEAGQLVFGTIDSWLIYKLTGGTAHVTDYSNAARTLLYNIHTLSWDEELLTLFRIPPSMCPRVVDSSGVCALSSPGWLGREIPIAGIAGDQQAALFGQGCFRPGDVKNTYGTGSFLLMNTGSGPVASAHGLLTTIAWGLAGQITYALEGSIFITGAIVQWLRDQLQIIRRAEESEDLALSIDTTQGVYVVPALAGLGAPYWDSYARGTIIGLTRGTHRAHIVRAALESIAYQTRDVLDVMVQDTGNPVKTLRVDGGAIANRFLAQFQADILGRAVERPQVRETTAMGAAFLAGLATGMWPGFEPLEAVWRLDEVFTPKMTEQQREALYRGWLKAVDRARNWVDPA